jgi:hypothetical protein
LISLIADYIRPICLPKTRRKYDSLKYVVTGWGKKSDADRTNPNVLSHITGVAALALAKCKRHYRVSKKNLCDTCLVSLNLEKNV